MKHVYSFIPKTLLIATGFMMTIYSKAQNPTTTSTNGDCSVIVQNFNSNSGGHSSPSIYGGTFDSAMYYNQSLGLWTEMGTNKTDPNQFPRTITIISPPYVNPNPPTIFDVGFWYKTSSATADRFQVRLVAISPGPAGTTQTNLVASSSVQAFSNWSTYATVTDANNPSNSGDTGRVCIRLIDPDITNGPNTFYRIEIAFIENGPYYAAYDNLSIGPVIQQSTLPVNFIGVVANKTGNGVNVKWDVGDEINVQEYQLEKSTNGYVFNTVGTVSAQNKSVYSYTDNGIKSNVIYYRVRSVDIDGKSKYSGIIKLTYNNSFSNIIMVYPTVAQSQITIQHSQLPSNAKVLISTSDGRILKTVVPNVGVSNTMIDVSNLSAGMYIVKLDHGDGKSETAKFVKQ